MPVREHKEKAEKFEKQSDHDASLTLSEEERKGRVGESFLDFCVVQGRSNKAQESLRQSQNLKGPVSARMGLPSSYLAQSLTGHGL